MPTYVKLIIVKSENTFKFESFAPLRNSERQASNRFALSLLNPQSAALRARLWSNSLRRAGISSLRSTAHQKSDPKKG